MKIAAVFILISGLLMGDPEGYQITNNQIYFIYPSTENNLEVFVSGNFNAWSNDKEWKMSFEDGKGYVLAMPINTVRQEGKSFYEFTFRVNGKLINANATNVIHCAGYGSRYNDSFLNNQ